MESLGVNEPSGLFTRNANVPVSVKVTIKVLHCVGGDSAFAGQNRSITNDTVNIDTMINYDGDLDGHGDGEVTCKQTFSAAFVMTTLLPIFDNSRQKNTKQLLT